MIKDNESGYRKKEEEKNDEKNDKYYINV